MRIRRLAILSGCVLAATLASTPGEARMTVEEEESSAGGGGGGGGSHGFTTTSSDGNYKLTIGGRLQGKFEFIGWDESAERDDTITFVVPRARLYFVGHVMDEDNKFFPIITTAATKTTSFSLLTTSPFLD